MAGRYSLAALLALGVSYVNEMDKERALKTLETWVKHNPQFAGLSPPPDPYSDGSPLDAVMQLMLAAQAVAPADPDVAVVLGVLYNVSRDYDSAIECLTAATEARSDDYALWNKLGATRANG